MDIANHPFQLSLFPEIGIEGTWLEIPYDFARLDPDLAALCSEYGFSRLSQDVLGSSRKAPSIVMRDEIGASLCPDLFNRGGPRRYPYDLDLRDFV